MFSTDWLKVFPILPALDPPGRSNKPKPPTSLSANQSSAGVTLQWSLPGAQQPPITGFVLQSRSADEEWFTLAENINANSSQIVVEGLQKVKGQCHSSFCA